MPAAFEGARWQNSAAITFGGLMAENWLKDYGFTAMQLPRRDLAPGDVLYRANGAFDTKVGTLPMLFSSSGRPAGVVQGEPTANIARTVTKKVEAGLGLKILGALFGAATSSKLGAETEFKHARSLAVTYENVQQDSLAVLELQAWLERANVDTSGQAMIWLNDDRLAAVTAVLRTAELSVAAERDGGGTIELSVPEIQGIVGGQANVSAASGSVSKVTFTGAEPIGFGFQAFKMIFEGNVSFGLEQIRGRRPEDLAADAWVADEELGRIADGSPTDD